MSSKNDLTQKEKNMAMLLSETLETLEGDYTYREFIKAASLLFRLQADKFNLHFGPTPGDG